MRVDEPHSGKFQDDSLTFGNQRGDHSLQFTAEGVGDVAFNVKDYLVLGRIAY